MNIKLLDSGSTKSYDRYVLSHPGGTLYHLSGWKNVIEHSYGHRIYGIYAEKTKDHPSAGRKGEVSITGGVLLVHMKNLFSGNNLISIPYFDMGGILADDEETETALLTAVADLGRKLKVDRIELRHLHPLRSLPCTDLSLSLKLSDLNFSVGTQAHKVRMVLELPESANNLMSSFKSKLRSQIKKPVKEGLLSRVGGGELLDDFYDVFSANMRDLGSPVHAREIIAGTLAEFPKTSRIIMVYKGRKPIACSLIAGFRDTLENPWASSLRRYSRLSPNMMLYWSMLDFACKNGYRYFDFGRSTPGEGTYRFKEQWGAVPAPLYWHTLSRKAGTKDRNEGLDKGKFHRAISCWKKIPLPLTRIIGPKIRKHIGL